MHLRRIGDRVGNEPVLRGRRTEIVSVVLGNVLKGCDLQVGKDQVTRSGVVAVGAHHLDKFPLRVLHARSGEGLQHELGRTAQVVGRVVRPQIPAMTHDRAVLLQPATGERLLAISDFGARENDLALRVDHLFRLGHRVGIGSQREKTHNCKTKDHHQGHTLNPPLGDHQLRSHLFYFCSNSDHAGNLPSCLTTPQTRDSRCSEASGH